MKKVPLRQCVGCREMKAKKELIRVVKTPEGEVVLDTTGRTNGRGAYLCKSSQCLAKAMKSKVLERTFQEIIPESVYEQLTKELDASE